MLKTYCINLDKRQDRWAEVQASCQQAGMPMAALSRFPACEDADFGALGCAKSHVAVLADFLTRSDASWCLVLEDDFEFVKPWADFAQRFNALASARVEWDVLMLAGANVMAEPPQPPGVARVFEAQTTAGYLVSRAYAPRLLACFADSVPLMERLRAVQPRQYAMIRLSIDQVWKRLQRQDRWFILSPAVGRQRPSFSDIEGRHVDYDSQSYGLETA